MWDTVLARAEIENEKEGWDGEGEREREGERWCLNVRVCVQTRYAYAGMREHITKASDKEAVSTPTDLPSTATKVALDVCVWCRIAE